MNIHHLLNDITYQNSMSSQVLASKVTNENSNHQSIQGPAQEETEVEETSQKKGGASKKKKTI